jgi:hypothetical protein
MSYDIEHHEKAAAAAGLISKGVGVGGSCVCSVGESDLCEALLDRESVEARAAAPELLLLRR